MPLRRRPIPFSPLEFGDSLRLWLDAADPGVFTLSTGISQWRDKGPRGAHANQATGASQPTLVADVLNGLPAVRCASQGMVGALVLTSPVLSVFAVATMQTGTASSGRMFAAAATAGNDSSSGGLTVGRDGSLQALRLQYTAASRTQNNCTYNTPFIVGHVFDAAGVSSRINGGTATTSASAPTFGTNIYSVGSGIAAGVLSAVYWLNDIFEIIVVTKTLDDSIRLKLEGSLAQKWARTLVADHPYQAAPP